MRYVCPECGSGPDAGSCPADGTVRVPAGGDALLGTTIGSWRVARTLGAGGMGRVYAAVQPQIGARVAIKVLKSESSADETVVERFFNEARAVNVIKHENIVDVIDLGRLPDGAPYIVMEYLEGASLGAILRREKRIALGTLARIVGEVLAALEAAHAKGIVHRDLKPDNVFVSPSGRVTVLDFGIAKLTTADGLGATQTGSLLGTPAYMSPEQARSQPLDARADLYAVGVMLYEGATGTLPFTATNLFDLLHLHVNAAPELPRARNPEIPEALEAVILRALEKKPEQRFASAAEMRRALAEATRGLPQLALSSLALGGAEPPAKRSDPLGATAQESLARGETMPSAPPPQPASKPAQRSRKTLIAVIAGAALLGLGATVLVVALGGREEPAPRVENAPPSAAPAVADGPSVALDEVRPPAAVDVTSPPMAGRVDASPPSALTRSDAASPMPGRIDAAAPARPDAAPPPARPDAVTPPMRPDAGAQPVRSDAASPSSAGEVIGVDRPTTPDYKALVVPNPRAFDPQAYYKTALAEANRLSGGAAPIMIRWHHVDRSGKIDVAGGGSAMYDFASAERIRANDPTCLVSVSIEAKNPHAARGSFSNDPDACKRQRALAPPKCTGEQLWEKALATGKVPDDAKHATLSHNYARGWVFSTEGSDAIDLPDDCP